MLLDLVLTLALAGVFFVSGIGKLVGLKQVSAQFVRWGYGPSVRIAGGALEVGGAALLLVPDYTLYGALTLVAVLVTAVYTHVVREKIPKHSAAAVMLLVLVIVLGLIRGPATTGIGGAVFRATFG